MFLKRPPGQCHMTPEILVIVGSVPSTLNVRGPSYLGLTRSISYSCWCPGSLRRQDISSNDIDYVEYEGPGVTWGRILSTCVISMWSNDKKCKYMFMCPLQNLACKELTSADSLSLGHLPTHFNEILFDIQIFSFKKMRLKLSLAKCIHFV